MTWLLSIIASPIFRALWRPFAIVLGVLTFGAFKRREGAQAAKAKQAEAHAKAYRETIERVADEKPSNDTTDRLRERMRQRAERKP